MALLHLPRVRRSGAQGLHPPQNPPIAVAYRHPGQGPAGTCHLQELVGLLGEVKLIIFKGKNNQLLLCEETLRMLISTPTHIAS